MPRRLRVSRLQALNMVAASGSFQWAGYDASLIKARHLEMQATRGIFQWAGFNANLAKAKYTMTATRGLFSMTGNAVTFTYTPSNNLGWLDNIFPMTIARGGFFDLAPHITGNINQVAAITANVSLPSGVAITNTPTWRITASNGATIGTTNLVNLTISQAADFQTRASGASVVWWHNFANAAEVNQFRWTGAFGSGQDPNGSGNGGSLIQHVATGGPSGGGFLRARYPMAGGGGKSYWWRPFNPLTGATNGKGVNDPGASATIPAATWTVVSGGDTMNAWNVNASNPGWYMNAAHQAANAGKFQGTDFYVQLRMRRAQTPGPPPNTVDFSFITGKGPWFTISDFTACDQELVTYGQSVGNGDQVGVHERHNVYIGQNFTSIGEQGSGPPNNATTTVSNITGPQWRYSGGWDTLLYHITPGTEGGTGSNRTRIEVWAQHDPTLFPAEAGVYTQIWDVTLTSTNYEVRQGWNAMICGAYHNGSVFTTGDFQFDYGDIIFSKATIAAPTV